MISSKSNAAVRSVRKLLASAKERKARGLFVIEGLRLVKEAPADWIDRLYISESLSRSGEIDNSFRSRAEIVSDDVFRSISDTVTPQGILAVVRQPVWSPDLLRFEDGCRLLLLDDIQDPGNLGTILRTAEAAGVDLAVLSEGCADLFNPKAIRATMGSIFRLPCIIDDLVSVIEMLKTEGVRVYGAALEGSTSYREAAFPEKTAIVIGNEGSGISAGVLNSVNEKIRIPMEGKVESLNVAVSAAILLFQIKDQHIS